MKLTITVKPNAKQNHAERMADGGLKIFVKAPAKEGRANEAVIEVVAKYLNIPKSRVVILNGHRGKKKILEVR